MQNTLFKFAKNRKLFMNASRLKVQKGRPKVLFVDDDNRIHKYTTHISKTLRLHKRTAFDPVQAKRIINLRLRAIERLKARLWVKKELAKTKEERAELIKRILALNKLKKNPFALIVSDVNMPRGNPTGINFVQEVRRKLPQQKILMHSDDINSLDYLMEKGFEREIKETDLSGKKLKERIKSELWPAKYPRKRTPEDWS